MSDDNVNSIPRTDSSRSSVEITRNSKGYITFKVKGYNGDLTEFEAVKEKSIEIFEALQEQYPDGK